ncbi:hypothetical protein SS50377_27341 [Spironucleus salmonicida]|uniref:Uncharacterized protein n=1 Tax=Spironucleus salmonicida TaxID=348837 RepID=V6LGD5_9EUKA|nr:hypothetical protein SS50377_27341 [Spironucleus salmonicida]|eukprot:EST43358.1 Hypothetical protein SS50377_17037 [Spironucleus salmonicida]
MKLESAPPAGAKPVIMSAQELLKQEQLAANELMEQELLQNGVDAETMKLNSIVDEWK